MRLWIAAAVGLIVSGGLALPAAANGFRVTPYLQNPAADAMTVRWLTDSDQPGQLTVTAQHPGSADASRNFDSTPVQPPELAYNPFGPEPDDRHAGLPWLHSIRVTRLTAATVYRYVVRQGSAVFEGSFRTAPGLDQPVRIAIYADSETEPESTTSGPVDWPVHPQSNRPEGMTKYVVNQTEGYRQNLKLIAAANPDLLLISGDLVESGGEQRDWDEFWRHLAGDYGQLAARVPVLPAIGNHENYGGPGAFGGYSAEAANFGVGKFRTYFEVPPNGASDVKHVGRYYRIDYGPITLITVDSSDGLPHQTAADTNHNLSGSHAPDFNPGSEQHTWLEHNLREAQQRSHLTFVQFHHTSYGSGPHSVPFGTEGFSGQSGIAMRVLQPLLMRYGVDAVFCGHDEMLERSLVTGVEVREDGTHVPHQIHFYDSGIGGDGLRGPSANFDNPHRKFLAHDNSPEVWDGHRLVAGGKHYGHLDVTVDQTPEGQWFARIEPVSAFPVMNSEGKVTGWERRLYEDVVTIPQVDAFSASWPLRGDLRDQSGSGPDLVAIGSPNLKATGRDGKAGSAVALDGQSSWLEVPSHLAPKPGTEDFSVSLWLKTDTALDDVPGDLISQYDPATRTGFHLSLKSNAVTTSHANERLLTFGIDQDHASEWQDCGRPGNALLAFAMAEFEGALYAGTCEPGLGEAGHVYRYDRSADGTGQWTNCGSPDQSNSVTSLAVFHGKLYAGTGKYRVAGSALSESPNTTLGGRVFRYEGGTHWVDCGQLPATEAVGGLVVFRDQLYASSLYRPAGFFRFDGSNQWEDCGTPDGKRVVALGVYNGYLYANSYDGGLVFRYDGTSWTDCGQLGDNTQTYSFAVYQGRLFVGTWPSGRVYRFEQPGQWTDVGRLGEELEVMGMLVHNGRLIAGTLPLAEVYSYDGDAAWTRLTQLDHTPDVKYRRAWTMAEHAGRVYCSTLPSGHIYSFEQGRSVSAAKALTPGWHHVAAVRSGTRLNLYLDGKLVGQSRGFEPAQYDLHSNAPLRIGFGQNDVFRGSISDVLFHSKALTEAEIQQFAANKP